MRNSQLVTVSLPREVLEQVDAAAQKERRSRSNFIRAALEQSLTGAERLRELQAIADAAGNRDKTP
jgi:metal-responsive CopG/Arc/MetJ family transcriptional regulator